MRRIPERWESRDELFEGATVLEDLVTAGGSTAESAAILARYVVLRLALRAVRGRSRGATYVQERGAAVTYLASYRPSDLREHLALASIVRLSGEEPDRALASALIEAGGHAARLGHSAGAFALCRAAYELALEHGWWLESARAAASVARQAAAGGGRHSTRLWRRRARVLMRRVALEAAAATGRAAPGSTCGQA